jgi:hypothetical protein
MRDKVLGQDVEPCARSVFGIGRRMLMLGLDEPH